MFGFVCCKIGLFPALLHREKVFCQFTASHAAFYLILLQRTFRLSSAKLRCFQHYRTGSSLSSYVKCAFDPLSYRKHVLACWQWDRMFRAFCYKKPAISQYPFLSLIVAKIRFLHVGNKIALLWVLYHKKKGFCFFVAKTRWIRLYRTKNMFWFVCCNIGLFSVLLHQKEVFFQYMGSHPDFHSILLKQRFCFLLAKLRCLLRCSLFPWPNYTLDPLFYWKTCYGLFAVKLFPAILHRKNVFCLFALSHFDFYLILLKTNVSVYFRVSYAVFRIHVWRNSLYLFSYINCAVNPLSYRKHVLGFWQLQWKLRALAHKKQQFGFSLQNTLH